MVGAGTDRSRAALAGGPAIVLVRPQLAVNIGMCARAMANFGLDDLRLVNPREGWPRIGEYRDVAYAAAAGAAHLLDGARVFDSVEAAVARSELSLRATARERGQVKAVLAPARAMAETATARRSAAFCSGPSAPASTTTRSRSPTRSSPFPPIPPTPRSISPRRCCSSATNGSRRPTATRRRRPRSRAPSRRRRQREMMLAFFDFLEGKLDDAGFFRPVGKKPGMRRNLRNMFHRMAMTQQDVRTLWGAVVRLVEGPRVEVKTRKRNRPPRHRPAALSPQQRGRRLRPAAGVGLSRRGRSRQSRATRPMDRRIVVLASIVWRSARCGLGLPSPRRARRPRNGRATPKPISSRSGRPSRA